MLEIDPSKRPSAIDVLKNPIFKKYEVDIDLDNLLEYNQNISGLIDELQTFDQKARKMRSDDIKKELWKEI